MKCNTQNIEIRSVRPVSAPLSGAKCEVPSPYRGNREKRPTDPRWRNPPAQRETSKIVQCSATGAKVETIQPKAAKAMVMAHYAPPMNQNDVSRLIRQTTVLPVEIRESRSVRAAIQKEIAEKVGSASKAGRMIAEANTKLESAQKLALHRAEAIRNQAKRFG